MVKKINIQPAKPIQVGDKVHCGLVGKGGAGYIGYVESIDGRFVLLRSETAQRWGFRTYKGLLEHCTHCA